MIATNNYNKTEWMAGRWGLMVHWIAPGPSPEKLPYRTDLDDAVDHFDVPRFLEDFAATGAEWLIFTVGQNTGYYVSPNALLEEWAGPGHCSRRDLIQELSEGITAMPGFAGGKTRKRFIAYLPCEVAANTALHEAFRWSTEENTAQPAFQERYTRFLAEYAQRWGTNCSGWWFDGCYSWPIFPNQYMDWPAWEKACRSGNPDAVLAFNDGSFCVGNTNPVTRHQDYLAGETEVLQEGKIRLGREHRVQLHIPDTGIDPSTGCRWHALVPIDCAWGHGAEPWAGVFKERFPSVPADPIFPMESPVYSDDELLSFMRSSLSVGGAVTLNVGIYQEGHLGTETIAQLQRLRPALEESMAEYTEQQGEGAGGIAMKSLEEDLVFFPFAPISVQWEAGDITLYSATGSILRNCRPYLAWRIEGEEDWRETVASTVLLTDQNPDRLHFEARFELVRLEFELVRQAESPVWSISGTLTNEGTQNIELARCHYLQGQTDAESGLLGFDIAHILNQGKLQFARFGEYLPPSRPAYENWWGGMAVRWPCLPEPIGNKPNWAVSRDIAVLTTSCELPGWGMGFVGPGTAFGEIGYQTQSAGPAHTPTFYVGVLLDNILLGPGHNRILESALIWWGDRQTGIDLWANTSARIAGVQGTIPPLVGYCSWYHHGGNITGAQIEQATQEFASLPIPPGGRTIQIDDGFQRKPGDWQPNAKFADIWEALPAKITATGSIPGLWLAPTTVHHSHPLVEEHPDWLQRLPSGQPAISFANWEGDTYYLEPDHPEVRQFLREIFENALAAGWRYFKLDFVYPVSNARRAYDRSRTTFETLRELFAFFREVCGPDILLNACIGEPGRYALGQVDIARLGGDTHIDWKNVYTSIQTILSRISTSGIWWQGDPDIYYARRIATHLSLEENFVLLGTVGLLGGTFLTSDLPSLWSAEAEAQVRHFWDDSGPPTPISQRVVWNASGEAEAYRVTCSTEGVLTHSIGLYNLSDTPRDTLISLLALGLNPDLDWQMDHRDSAGFSSATITLHPGQIFLSNQAAHSLRIVTLTAQTVKEGIQYNP